jgi:maltooligosyltrehalose trehalohydrolase
VPEKPPGRASGPDEGPAGRAALVGGAEPCEAIDGEGRVDPDGDEPGNNRCAAEPAGAGAAGADGTAPGPEPGSTRGTLGAADAGPAGRAAAGAPWELTLARDMAEGGAGAADGAGAGWADEARLGCPAAAAG